MADDDGGEEPNSFVKLPDPSAGAFADPGFRAQLQKWDLARNSRMCRFRYTRPFHRRSPGAFLRDLFDSDAGRAHLRRVNAEGEWVAILPEGKCEEVRHRIVPCTATSMTHFDRLYDAARPPIVREGTQLLMKRVDEVMDGFTVTDRLREFLLTANGDGNDYDPYGIDDDDDDDGSGESNYAELMTTEQRDEFLFRVFAHLALGGSMCQYEERMDAYTEAAKRAYKSLVAARRDRASGEDGVAVASDVYRVDGFVAAGRGDDDTAGGDSLFPGRSVQNFCYVVVDPRKRHATVWYHAYRPYW